MHECVDACLDDWPDGAHLVHQLNFAFLSFRCFEDIWPELLTRDPARQAALRESHTTPSKSTQTVSAIAEALKFLQRSILLTHRARIKPVPRHQIKQIYKWNRGANASGNHDH
jgi:hypothetical protein